MVRPVRARRRWLPVLLLSLAALAAAMLLWYERREPGPDLPPSLTRAELEALSEVSLVSAVTNDLRLRMSAAGATSGRWRSWPEPARHVLAWSWVETDLGAQAPPRFPGFAALFANPSQRLPSYADIADAYQALGAAPAAAVVREAEALAGGLEAVPEGANPFAALDRRFVQALGRGGTVAAMRAYIRAHLDEIAAAR
jgi:hypothetical protein